MAHVLVADDDGILRKRIVRAIGKEVPSAVLHEAADGEEAMSLLKELFDNGQEMALVITDIQMPKASGLMLLAFLNAFAPHVPCFVMTSYGTSRLKAKTPPDLLRFYDKPFDVEEMALSTKAALNRQADSNACDRIQLADFIHLCALNRTTATVTVTREGEPPCTLFLRDGDLIDAAGGDAKSEKAAIIALSWPNSAYAVRLDIPDDIQRTIKTPVNQLLRTVSECFDRNDAPPE